ncbi:MAG: hypothetical protein NXH97_21085 [Rhodobacteraceae bacterium]|nr:hypothetical protein [Paracoccaceae bacterium]
MTKSSLFASPVSVSFALRDSLPDHGFADFYRRSGEPKAAFTKAVAAQIEPPKPPRFICPATRLPQAVLPDPRPSYARKGTRDADWFFPLKPEAPKRPLTKDEFVKARAQQTTRSRSRNYGR